MTSANHREGIQNAMNITYHKWHSPNLNREMELKVYGHEGKPFIVFPSSAGRFFDYENNGMVEACASFVRRGKVTLITVDSIDSESWLHRAAHPWDRAAKHDAYENYIIKEVMPFVQHLRPEFQKAGTTGCSMGAFHAANFLFRNPRYFDTVIALSGLYGPRYMLGDYMDDRLYFYFPLCYLPGLNDPAYLASYRNSQIILCVGQGPWEKCDQYDCIDETLAMKKVLDAKKIPVWADFWGYDVNHDWVWWKKQMPYFLKHLHL